MYRRLVMTAYFWGLLLLSSGVTLGSHIGFDYAAKLTSQRLTTARTNLGNIAYGLYHVWYVRSWKERLWCYEVDAGTEPSTERSCRTSLPQYKVLSLPKITSSPNINERRRHNRYQRLHVSLYCNFSKQYQ
jgi:hypothetical protein